MTTKDLIVVGVDGSAAALTATRWAAHEAERLGRRLRLVHVFPDDRPIGGFSAAAHPLGALESRQAAERILRTASDVASQVIGAERVESALLRGDRRAGLLQEAAGARLVVLGDEPHPLLERLITGSVVASVAAHSPAPVVVVPASWEAGPSRRTVLAGVRSPGASGQLARHAAGLAAGRGARLVLLHAWEGPLGYDDLVGVVDTAEWHERARQELTELADELAPGCPGVDIEVRVVHGQPAAALRDASAEADLLVLTRRQHGFPFGHLGATGRAVLRETRCPAIVLPPAVAAEDISAAS